METTDRIHEPARDRILALEPGHGPVLVLGAPGTGKTSTLLEVVVRRLDAGHPPEALLVIAPSRTAAGDLRDRLSAASDATFSEPAVRTWAAYAFDLIRRARLEGFLPAVERPPRLLSGPEQDTLIAELLAGHATGITRGPVWPDSLGEAIGTRGFRKEIRELFDRLAEYGLEAGDLEDLGRRCLRPEWTASAALYQEYRDLLDLGSSEAFDPAGLITAAADLLEGNPGLLEDERDRLTLLVVDDLQEANPAQHRLLRLLASGRDLLAFASPDNAVQGFRGARPDLLGRFDSYYGTDRQPANALELDTSWRMRPAIAEAWTRVAGRIPVTTGGAGRRLREGNAEVDAHDGDASGDVEPPRGNVEVHLVQSPVHELRLVTQRLLEEHLMGGRALDSMAVVVRNGGQVAAISRHLAAQGIPVNVPRAEMPLRDEPAVRPLLTLLKIGLATSAGPTAHDTSPSGADVSAAAPPMPEAGTVEALLASRYGASSALDIRRLRQVLRRQERVAGGQRSSTELLRGILGDPSRLTGHGREGRGAERLARMLAALVDELSQPSANAETALWALWSASGLETPWRQAAVEGGAAGARADHDLDALMALFQAAERFVDQLPGSTVGQFTDHVLGQELPMDTLASRGGSGSSVAVATPAGAVGHAWDLVLVPGLQEGIWPNTRLRGELLGSSALADVLEHGPAILGQRDPATRLRATRADELRTFASAISRAGQTLVCIGVASEDHQPSQFLDLVQPWTNQEEPRPMTTVPRERTLASLVALLRQRLEDGITVPELEETAHDAAAVLARLADQPGRIRGARPTEWWGLLPASTDAPVNPPGEPVRVSPSRVQAALESPLDWFVQAAGGEPATDLARSLGTLVHAIAEDLPAATGNEYLEELDRRWPDLDLPPTWETAKDHERAETMLRKLAQYAILMRGNDRELLARERDFDVEIADADITVRLRGVIDRLEVDAEGRAYVVDLKTGKSAPTKAEVERNPQLGSYQAAVLAGALGPELPTRPAGAALVQLGTTAKSPGEQAQEPVGDDDWATPMVLAAARLMAGNGFQARHDPSRAGRTGSGCRLPSVCPLCDEGRQVTE
ncbi:ATP-dependent helicase [Arthrobacter sp. JSM 101049]|uniref:ATP-dependent helicase n=1 Tax=Arthrobacter sp. JSM 101049 TaxID=929097 RepID=UPI0035670697